MSYNPLGECTLTAEERLLERDQILVILKQIRYTGLSDKEVSFVTSIATKNFISVNQLFWLRDIKDRIV